MAIRNIRHSGLRRLFEREDAHKLHAAHVPRIRAILAALDRADAMALLSQPTYRLHPLKGDLAGQWVVAVSRTWRIVFRVESGDVFDVDLVDYH